jgi:hypothetical protein
MSDYWSDPPVALIGRTVTSVWFSDDYLTFETDQGLLTYTVYGDCCSSSYFNDFVGLSKLLENGAVTAVTAIALDDTAAREDLWRKSAEDPEEVEFYGYAITTVHPRWGEQTTVFSFRNESNGYYGGWLSDPQEPGAVHESQRKLTADVVTS